MWGRVGKIRHGDINTERPFKISEAQAEAEILFDSEWPHPWVSSTKRDIRRGRARVATETGEEEVVHE